MKFLDYFPQSVFQTFKDNDKANGYAKVFEKYDEVEFKKLNSQGCGVYFTPNACKGGRKEENLIKLWCVFGDLDVAKEGDGSADILNKKMRLMRGLMSDKLVPNFVIDTKNGLQPLWLIEPLEPTQENKDSFVKAVQGIIEWSKGWGAKGDQVKDLVRVLRLPNYYHMKSEPYLCEARKYFDDKYPLDLICEAFPYEEKTENPVQKSLLKKGFVVQEIDRIDFKDLIIRAFANVGRVASFDNQDRLLLDGRLTGTFQGKNGDRNYLASTSHEPFKGNRITVVADILGVTNKEAFKWIKEEYGLNEEKIKATKVEIKNPEKKEVQGYYSWGTDVLTKSFAPIKRNTHTVLVGETGDGKTTYAYDLAIKNAKLGHKVLYISLEMTAEELFENIARNYSKITIEEEVFKTAPEGKQKAFKRKIDELKSVENLKTKGIVGTNEVNWEVIVKMMEGEWDLIFIDNLDLVAGREGESDWERQKRISKNILNYCNDKQVPIFLLHHYRKGQGSKVRSIHDISGSGKITHNSHRVVLLSRIKKDDATKLERASLNLLLDKARGYSRAYKTIYFYRGSFYDEYPENEPEYASPQWWAK